MTNERNKNWLTEGGGVIRSRAFWQGFGDGWIVANLIDLPVVFVVITCTFGSCG